MGKTPKPLTILCDPTIAEWEELQALKSQQHRVVVPLDLIQGSIKWEEIDLIFDGRAWRMNAQLRPYIGLAITEGRKVRYPKEKD
jgi:hypothetical protein